VRVTGNSYGPTGVAFIPMKWELFASSRRMLLDESDLI